MKIYYSDEPLKLEKDTYSIFLAGPTPRSLNVPSWRDEALKILHLLDYQFRVIVPERKIRVENIDYDTQVEWENYGTENCSKIVFWIPRRLDSMPGFTTNVEFGRYVESGKIIYGRPDNAEKTRYLDWLYQKYNNPFIYNNLTDLLKASI